MIVLWLLALAGLDGVVDRIEGRWAVLEVRGREVRVGRARLPRGVREGDHLRAGRIDRAATERARAEARALLRRLLRPRPAPAATTEKRLRGARPPGQVAGAASGDRTRSGPARSAGRSSGR